MGFRGFTHGVAAGDVNGDGFPDLLLTNFGPNVLYLNNGDGRFRDASRQSGLDRIPWSLGAAFLDFDSDGDLDVYVTSYTTWVLGASHAYCGDSSRNLRIYCSPYSFAPVRHHLLRNDGQAHFEDVTKAAGIERLDGRGLGVVAADVNRDGRIDVFVANDGCPNFLFVNRGGGRFEDVSESSAPRSTRPARRKGAWASTLKTSTVTVGPNSSPPTSAGNTTPSIRITKAPPFRM